MIEGTFLVRGLGLGATPSSAQGLQLALGSEDPPGGAQENSVIVDR